MKKYIPKKPLWEKQVGAIKKMYKKRAFGLMMAMRTGKSPTTLSDFGQLELEGLAKDLFVIAPAGVYRTWAVAFKEHGSDDLQSRMLVHVWESGDSVKKKKDRKAFLEWNGPRMLLMNCEAISLKGPAREFVAEYLRQRSKLTYVVIDESTRIKNKSKRTDFVIKVIRPLAAWRRILSGLMTPVSPLDLFFQYYFLDPKILGFGNWRACRAHVAYMKQQWLHGRLVELIDKEQGNNGFRPEAVKEMQRLIEPHSIRVPFDPKVPPVYSIREVELTKEQKKHYAEMKEFATTKIAGEAHVTATVVIAQMMRLHQIVCGHTNDEEGNEHLIPENRTAELLDLLEDYDGKAVIWCSYDTDVRKVSEALARKFEDNPQWPNKHVARFWGGNTKTREAERDAFLKDPQCRYIVATPDSGGMGQTWSNAHLSIYYSSKDNLEHRMQSEQRTMGVEKTIGCEVIDLVAPGTVDMPILHAMRNKLTMASVINGDNYREWLV